MYGAHSELYDLCHKFSFYTLHNTQDLVNYKVKQKLKKVAEQNQILFNPVSQSSSGQS